MCRVSKRYVCAAQPRYIFLRKKEKKPFKCSQAQRATGRSFIEQTLL